MNQPRLAARIAASLMAGAVVYCVLCLGDYALTKRNAQVAEDVYAMSQEVDARRYHEQDKAMIQEARSQGYKPVIYPSFFEKGEWRELAERAGIAPLAPQPNTPLYLCNEGYGLIRYRSDRFGFRNDDRVWDTARLDFVLIGNSFAQGDCIEEGDSIAGQLASSSRAVVNLATGSNTPIHYVALAKTFLPLLSTRYVVVVFTQNDNAHDEDSIYRKYFVDGSVEYLSRGADHRQTLAASEQLKRLYVEAQALADAWIARGDEVGFPTPAVGTGKDPGFFARGNVLGRAARYLALSETRRTLRVVLPNVGEPEELPWSSKLAIDVILKSCEERSCLPVFVYIPYSTSWNADPRAQDYRRALRSYVMGQSDSAVFVDTSEEIGRRGRAAYASVGEHLSPLGYRVVAEQIISSLHP